MYQPVAVAAGDHAQAHESEHEVSKFGMWLFLASEVMFFAAFIAAYVVLRAHSRGAFAEAARELNVVLAAVNTLALITSSLTMVLAVGAAQRGDRRGTVRGLAATIALGCVFLVIKYFEYSAKFHHGIYPSTNAFFGCYFLLTGFHGLHVLAGIIALSILLVVASRGVFRDGYYTPVECTGLYWHLVDVVWIFLFPILYLLH
ncbi:MAG: cytochrome c oxidase subunit 3 family protein [Planctomycetes bacterium]|nr:cytochrome c oxidase subunit 3 family protein [Planctomycetota bacterium]